MNRIASVALVVFLLILVSDFQFCWGQNSKFDKIRTWSDSSEKFKTDAKLMSVKFDSVELENVEGKKITLPIARLCPSDQAFIDEFKLIRFEKLKAKADACVFASEALALYREYDSSGFLEPKDRLFVETTIAELEKQSQVNAIILSSSYLPQAELEARKRESQAMVNRWLLESSELKSGKERKLLNEASRLDPTSIEAALLSALYLEVNENDPESAQRRLEEAIVRGIRYVPIANESDKKNLNSALNNLAISYARNQKISLAMKSWAKVDSVVNSELPTEALHNIAKVKRMLENKSSGLFAERRIASAFYDFATEVNAQGESGGWRFLTAVDFEGRVRTGVNEVMPNGGAKVLADGVIEDTRCVICNGLDRVDCLVRECVRGKVEKEIFGPKYLVYPDGRRQFAGNGVIRVDVLACPGCNGGGFIKCRCCDKGRQVN